MTGEREFIKLEGASLSCGAHQVCYVVNNEPGTVVLVGTDQDPAREFMSAVVDAHKYKAATGAQMFLSNAGIVDNRSRRWVGVHCGIVGVYPCSDAASAATPNPVIPTFSSLGKLKDTGICNNCSAIGFASSWEECKEWACNIIMAINPRYITICVDRSEHKKVLRPDEWDDEGKIIPPGVCC